MKLSVLLGIIHQTCGLILLIFSAWFIAASAIAGIDYPNINFNYLLPAAIIRALALTRIATGYSQMYSGHKAILKRIKNLRQQLFQKLKNHTIQRQAESTEALAHHSETLASIHLNWSSHNLALIAKLIIISLAIAHWLPENLNNWLIFTASIIILMSINQHTNQKLSQKLIQEQTDFRHQSAHHLASAPIWHLISPLRHPNAQTLYQHKQQSTHQQEKQQQTLQLIALIILIATLAQTQAPQNAVFMIYIITLLTAKDWLSPAIQSQNKLSDYQQSQHSIHNIQKTPIANHPPIEPIKTLELNNFSAQNRPIKTLTFSLKTGQIILLKGSSGSGKTSILKAISGLLPHQGEKIHNHHTLSQGHIHSWLYLEQSPRQLSGNLATNLRLANPQASDSELHQALEFADLSHLTELKQWLGEQGRTLSGGELKRLNLARAQLHRAQLYLFDEPFEGLNETQQQRMAHAIQSLAKQAPIIIASHINPPNLSTDKEIELD